ncbi:MAG TPA: GNAT family N-acetyltransferase [Marmoricola sp.]
MSGVEVLPVDPADEVLLRRIWEIGAAIDQETPTHDHESWPVARHTWTVPVSAFEVRLWCARVEGEPVGYAEVHLPLADNTHLVEVFVGVATRCRRRGVGTALLDAVCAHAGDAGRSVLMTGFSAASEGIGPGEAFARAHAFELAQFDIEKSVTVADQLTRWRSVLADVGRASTDYRIVSWVGPTPDEHLPALCALASGFVGEIPLGDLALEDEHWDERRFRERDARNAAAGRHEVTVVAYGPDDSPAGYSTIVVEEDRPEIASQDATLVVPAHRGHRLGLRLKAINQLAMVERFPQVRAIETGNAHDNDHMNAVNDLLGFRPIGRWLEMQRRL